MGTGTGAPCHTQIVYVSSCSSCIDNFSRKSCTGNPLVFHDGSPLDPPKLLAWIGAAHLHQKLSAVGPCWHQQTVGQNGDQYDEDPGTVQVLPCEGVQVYFVSILEQNSIILLAYCSDLCYDRRNPSVCLHTAAMLSFCLKFYVNVRIYS